jgi:hypothetical protein
LAFFAALTLPALYRFRAEAATGRKSMAHHIILLWLGGGQPHQDMGDMKREAPAEIRGEFKPIKTNAAGINICELMLRLAKPRALPAANAPRLLARRLSSGLAERG